MNATSHAVARARAAAVDCDPGGLAVLHPHQRRISVEQSDADLPAGHQLA